MTELEKLQDAYGVLAGCYARLLVRHTKLTTEVRCYWCGDVLGGANDGEAIRAHVASCAKRVTP